MRCHPTSGRTGTATDLGPHGAGEPVLQDSGLHPTVRIAGSRLRVPVRFTELHTGVHRGPSGTGGYALAMDAPPPRDEGAGLVYESESWNRTASPQTSPQHLTPTGPGDIAK